MIRKPSNYDEIEVNDKEFIPLEIGGHKCVIMKAEEYKNPDTGKESLKIYLDTDKSDKQPEYFANLYRNDTRPDKSWDKRAIIYLPLSEEESKVRMFKAGITAIEKSNNFKWNFNENDLVNKKVGCIFGLEEYKNQEGKIKVKTRARRLRSIDKVDKIGIPDVRLLNGSYETYDDYMERKENRQSTDSTYQTVQIDEDNLPF